MPDRLVPVFRICCLGLGVLILFQFIRAATRKSPLDQLRIPTVLSSAAASKPLSNAKETNATAPNAVGFPARGTNTAGTNAVGTNASAIQASPKKETNSPAASKTPNPATRTMIAGGRAEFGKMAPDLPPAIQARVERITQSEILGPVIRPLPMALQGIAGQHAVFRAPNGQVGLLREGEELGGVKLLRLGTNRVLIEQDGQKKELMIFSGFGSETLLPKEKEKPQ